MINRRDFLAVTATAAVAWKTRQAALFAQSASSIVCPKASAPARKLSVFDLRDLTSFAEDFRLTLHCLQGLVNRRQPRLYLIQDHYDELWLDWLRERGDIDATEQLEIGHVLDRFVPEAGSMYITDPAIPASVNVATMLASLDSALVATPAIAEQFNLSAGNFPDDSKVGYDLRRFHWKKDVDAYRWFFSLHEQRLSRSAVAMLDPSTSALRDYLVAFRIPTVWISSFADAAHNPQADNQAEIEFVRELFLRWPSNIPCFGWPGNGVGPEEGIGEWDGVRIASECAKFEVCSAYDGYSPTVSNLTVHSGTNATFKQRTYPMRLEKDKFYIALIRSDGDGLNFQRHYYRKLFDDTHHGAVPMGWQIGATAADVMPDILDYYYRHAKPGDCFVNALTGVGYIHEDSYADSCPPADRAAIWKQYIEISERYRARIDASTMSTFEEMDPEHLQLIASIAGVRGLFANYGRTHVTNAGNLLTMVNGKPMFRSVNGPPHNETFSLEGRRQAVDFVIRSIRENTPKSPPFFLHVFLANWLITMDMTEDIVHKLGERYVAVRPDQLVSLFGQSKE